MPISTAEKILRLIPKEGITWQELEGRLYVKIGTRARTQQRVKEIIQKLADYGFIKYDKEKVYKVKEVE